MPHCLTKILAAARRRGQVVGMPLWMVSAASAAACQSNALVDTWLIPDHLAGGRSDPILASSWSVSGPCQQSINNGKKWARWHNKQKAGQACRQLGCAGLISKADMQRMRFPARPN